MNATSYELYLKKGPTPGIVYSLTDKGLTIGRDPLSDILINDPEVSRQHALLKRTATGDYYIQDLGSTNGTYVDGNRLGSEPFILKPSNAILLGGAVTLIFRERSSKSYPANAHGRVDRYTGQAQRKPDVALGSENKVAEFKAAPQPRQKNDNPIPGGSPYPISRQPVKNSTGEEIRRPTPIETEPSAEISPSLILSVVLLLLCSCASVLVFLMYLGGDWFFREIGLVP